MIEPGKLFQLEGGQKRRKLALTFGALERDILGIAEKGTEYSFSNLPRAEYIKQVAAVLIRDPKLSDEAAAHLRKLLAADPIDELRICNGCESGSCLPGRNGTQVQEFAECRRFECASG